MNDIDVKKFILSTDLYDVDKLIDFYYFIDSHCPSKVLLENQDCNKYKCMECWRIALKKYLVL